VEDKSVDTKLQTCILNLERMARSCTEQSIRALDLSIVPEEVRKETSETKKRGLFEGMAFGYQLTAGHLRTEGKHLKEQDSLDDLVKGSISEFNDSAQQFREKVTHVSDEFAVGFFEGLSVSYVVASQELETNLR
jgi:hypothetical protein